MDLSIARTICILLICFWRWATIKFLDKAAKDSLETSFELTLLNSLFDGNWHNIRDTLHKNAVLLVVDHVAAPPGVGTRNPGVVFTNHSMFIGRHPGRHLRKLPGSTSRTEYVECIRNIMINKEPISLDPEWAYGKVTARMCPTI